MLSEAQLPLEPVIARSRRQVLYSPGTLSRGSIGNLGVLADVILPFPTDDYRDLSCLLASFGHAICTQNEVPAKIDDWVRCGSTDYYSQSDSTNTSKPCPSDLRFVKARCASPRQHRKWVCPDTGQFGPRADGPGGWDRMVLKWSKAVRHRTSMWKSRATHVSLLTVLSAILGIPAGIEGAGNG